MMIAARSHRRRRHSGTPFLLVVCVVVGMMAGVRALASFSSDAPFLEYPSGFVIPLNTTSVPQTKEGRLNIEMGVYAQGGLVVGSGSAPVQICWNGIDAQNCKDEWSQAGSKNYVTLQTDSSRSDDVGTVNLINDIEGPTSLFSMLTKASDPASGSTIPSSAIEGIAAADTGAFFSAGLAGSAGTKDLVDHFGIYATNSGERDAYAGRFNGNVSLRGKAGESSLVIGDAFDSSGAILPDIQFMRNNNRTVVCLNGNCRSAWSAPGTSIWQRNTGTTPNTLWPGSNSRSMSIGNGTFTVIREADLTATVTTKGDVTARTVTVGSPTSNVGLSVTCGDAQCSIGETASSCPDDCDTTPPNDITNLEITVDEETNVAQLEWRNPSSSDFTGTRVIYSFGIIPPDNDPYYGLHADVYGVPSGQSRIATEPLSAGKHYFALFTYDNSRTGSPKNFHVPATIGVVDIL